MRKSCLSRLLFLGTLLVLTPFALAATGKPLEGVPAAVSCASLAATNIEDIGGAGSRISRAAEVDENGIAQCVVEGTLAPAIGFRIKLPVKTWTQRYLQIGCGGLCGNIAGQIGAADGCAPLTAGGFVQGATDMGHQGMAATFGNDPQQRADFAYRAQHLTAVLAKQLIRSYYGRPQAYAYFTGCSDGGREALMEAQRYPEDFDGIIAGAAAMNFVVQNGLYHAWQARANTGPDGRAILVASRLPILHQAVLAQCDALDGQVDGLLTDPRACHFDPAAIQCPASQADTSACLTTAEVTAARKLYDGPRDPQSGERLTAGGPQPGSELQWAGVFVPMSADQPIFSTQIAEEALRYVLFETNPPAGFKLADLAFTRDTFTQLVKTHPLYGATNPDLARFAAAGHKLILWHGWSDPHISPLNTIAYHEALRSQLGDKAVAGFERLYLLPGVAHCSGGEGPSQLDLLSPMLGWVEHGEAPDAILTTQPDPKQHNSFGQPGGANGAQPPADAGGPPPGMMPLPAATSAVKSRPVYPYPAVARFSGKGDANLAASQQPGAPLFTGTLPAWIGSGLFVPYTFRP